jgi:D-inositol-3-phosphate glycosyltransferase
VERRKGYEHLVRALGTLRRRGIEAYLVVAGRDAEEGAESDRLRRIGEECEIAAFLRLPGHVDYRELPNWYGMCSIYAGASRGESPGLTYVEAMACRRPVVAFSDGAIPEVVIDQKTGFLVPPEDPAALAGALERLVTDAALRRDFGAAGELHVRESFSLPVTVAQQVEMYADVIGADGAGV